MKILLKLVLVVIVLLIVAGVGVYFYIDTIAKGAIERGSTSALGVETKVQTAHLELFGGRLQLKGVNVANPSGFQTNHFLNLKDGDVAVTLGSLRQDVVEVPHLTLADLDMNLEKKGASSNYQFILDHLKGSETDTKPKEGKRYVIRELILRNVNVHLDLGLGELSKLNLPIDQIKLENVGSDTSRGLLLKDLAGVIVKAVIAAAVEKGGGIIPADIQGELRSKLSQLQGLDKIANVKSLGELGKSLEGIGGKGGLGDKAKDALGGLLNNDKNKSTPKGGG